MVVKKDGEEKIIHLSKGVSTRTAPFIYHTIYAITELTVVAMLTKKWDDCDNPVIREEL